MNASAVGGRQKVAVFFGGRSPEHDVSVVTGLQVLEALDPALYDAFPVYVSPQGNWYVGDELRRRETYIPGPSSSIVPVVLHFGDGERPCLMTLSRSMFQRPRRIEVDFVIPAFHGLYGEDGCFQGLLEAASLPYSGMRVLASTIFMDKVATKHFLAGSSIQQLPFHILARPGEGLLITPAELAAMAPDVKFPCCVKPAHLGSSIGVARVESWQELSDVLPAIFQLDSTAIVEPFVQNLVEYNVSVCRLDGRIVTSAIEQPKTHAALLDFKEKYGTGGTKGGKKAPSQSQGMLSLTREINPRLPPDMEARIRNWATEAFARIGGTGAPRIDFLCDRQTGQIWLNEVNPIPGSFAYFLWEAAATPIAFSALLDKFVAEGMTAFRAARLPSDPVPKDARLLPRKG